MMNQGKGVYKPLNIVSFTYKYSEGKVFPIKGILKGVGISASGEAYLSILLCYKKQSRSELGNSLPEFYYLSKKYSLEKVVEKERFIPLFEGLK